MMMTRDKKILELIRRYFTPRDYMTVKARMVGTGMIGGKACGMLLARKIVREFCPQAQEHLEPHDSYYIASDIYYTYIIHNGCWRLWMYQKTHPEDHEAAEKLREKLFSGVFPDNIRSQLRRLLDYFGSSPMIVRSSSFPFYNFTGAFIGIQFIRLFDFVQFDFESKQVEFYSETIPITNSSSKYNLTICIICISISSICLIMCIILFIFKVKLY